MSEELVRRFAEFGVSIPPNAAERWPELGVPLDPYAELKRRQAAETLTKIGRPIAYATINTMASRGASRDKRPPYRLFGRRAIYRWGDLLKWSEGRITETRSTAIEGAVFAERRKRDQALLNKRDARLKANRAAKRAAKAEAARSRVSRARRKREAGADAP